MPSSSPTIVIVPGGWHIPESYKALTTEFKERGFDVRIPEILCVTDATKGLPEDTEVVREFFLNLINNEHREVIAVCHSYGGQIGTNALHGLGQRSPGPGKPGISNLIYIAGSALLKNGSVVKEGKEGVEYKLKNGTVLKNGIGVVLKDRTAHEHEAVLDTGSMLDTVGEWGHTGRMHAFPVAEDNLTVTIDNERVLFYNGEESDAVDDALKTLKHWNVKALTDRISNEAWREIPTTYVFTSKDLTLPVEYQRLMVKRIRAAGTEVRTAELDTGHSPYATKTKELAEIVEQIAKNKFEQKEEVSLEDSVKVKHPYDPEEPAEAGNESAKE